MTTATRDITLWSLFLHMHKNIVIHINIMTSKGFGLYGLQKRLTVLLVVIVVVFVALVARLFWVGVVSSEDLQKKAEDQWTRSLPIVANRGKILDTNGAELAVSTTTYNIFTRAREIKTPVDTANVLAQILNDKFSTILDKVCDKSASEILVATKIDTQTAIKIYQKQLDGVYVTENSTRLYPNGDALTQVLGFTTSDGQGQAGLEAQFDDILKGKNGYLLVQSDLTGVSLPNSLDTFIPATSGTDIQLTIDLNLQKFVEKTCEKIMVEQKAKGVNAILMKSKTGEILAMTSKPSFDLNNIPRDDVAWLMETVKNKNVVDVYEPGSTFKIITMAIALETGVAKLTDTFNCSGSCIVAGEKIKCWKSIGHGHQTLAEGLANSCNCVFTALAQRIGLEKFYDYLKKFGYGSPTNIDILGESGGILMNPSTVKTVDLARMGFGQAVAVTTLQQIVGVSCAVNGGNLVLPYLIKQTTSPSGKILPTSPVVKRQVISAETSQIINEMLDLTVSKQTGKFSFVSGYAVGGKTGTTQKYVDGVIKNSYISSFVGTYPVSDPEFTLLLAVDEPNAGAYYGSIVASPYAKEIFSKIFEYYSISPDDPNYQPLQKPCQMPNLIGSNLIDALNTLRELEIAYEIAGDGDKIVSQYPVASVNLFVGDVVQITLGDLLQ